MVIDTVALEKALKVEFNKAYTEMIKGSFDNTLLRLVTEVPSTSSSEKYGWLGDVPVVREWIGDKKAAGLKDYDYTIKNRDWYNAIAIDRNEIEDDQAGIIIPRVRMLTQSLAQHVVELVAELLKNGTTKKAYDGNPFFANRSMNDNLIAGTGTSLANLEADLATARAQMFRFKTDTGRTMRLTLDTIVCPPELEESFLKIVTSATPPSANNAGVANPNNRWIKSVIVEPSLEDTGDWYGFCSTMPLKPFIHQTRKKPVPVLDDSQVKRNRKLIFSAESRGDAGYGFYQMAIKVVNT